VNPVSHNMIMLTMKLLLTSLWNTHFQNLSLSKK